MANLSLAVAGTWAGVALIWSIVPLCWSFVFWELMVPTFIPSQRRTTLHGPLWKASYNLLLSYCLLEVVFSIYYRYLIIKVQRRRSSKPLLRRELRAIWLQTLYNGRPGLEQRQAVEDAFTSPLEKPRKARTPRSSRPPPLTDELVNDYRECMRYWFKGAPFGAIKRGNVLEWVSWSLYNAHYEELVEERVNWEKKGRAAPTESEGENVDDHDMDIKGDRLGLVEHCTELMEARANVTFEEGRSKEVKAIRLTLDPVRVRSRPLLIYALIHVMQKRVVKKEWGFVKLKEGPLSYLLRLPSGWKPSTSLTENERPLLFLHGLGAGTLQYSNLINQLATHPSLSKRPIIILLQPHISMSIASKSFLTPPDSVACVKGLLGLSKRWGFDKTGLTVLSHSNGSIAHGWLIREAPELCVRSCFVDPIPFCIWEPWVCFNFLYAPVTTPFEIAMRYFVARELGIATTIQRHFSWTDNLLLATHIPNLKSTFHTAFHLADQDSVINTSRIRKHLLEHGVEERVEKEGVEKVTGGGLKFHLNTRHGQSMTHGRQEIIRWLAQES